MFNHYFDSLNELYRNLWDTILILAPPTITSFTTPNTLQITDDLPIICYTQGIPSPFNRFFLNGSEIISDGVHIIQKSAHEVVILNVTGIHSGNYSCHAENLLGSVTQYSFTLVKGKQEIV